jgi:hypothetical protein
LEGEVQDWVLTMSQVVYNRESAALEISIAVLVLNGVSVVMTTH